MLSFGGVGSGDLAPERLGWGSPRNPVDLSPSEIQRGGHLSRFKRTGYRIVIDAMAL
jgi:hypothetical protein